MTEQQQARFEGWAIVDVMGHQRYVGYVTTEAYGAAVLFRIDVPALEARERTTVRPEYDSSGRYLPAGSVISEGAVEGYTKLVGSGSIYTMTPCTKDAALVAVEKMQARPLLLVTLPEGRALTAASSHGQSDGPAYMDDNDDDGIDPVDDDEDADEAAEVAEPEDPKDPAREETGIGADFQDLNQDRP